MRISDWSSDVCSSDLKQSSRTARSAAGSRSSANSAIRPSVSIKATWRDSANRKRGDRGADCGHYAVGNLNQQAGAGMKIPARLFAAAVLLLGLASCETRSEEHTSELQSLMRISYAVFCL